MNHIIAIKIKPLNKLSRPLLFSFRKKLLFYTTQKKIGYNKEKGDEEI